MSIGEGSSTGGPPTFAPRTTGRLEEKGRELGRKADAIGTRVQTGIRDKAHELEAAGQHLHEKLAGAKGRVAHGVHEGRERMTHEVQAHPVRTLVYAFGAGALVGLLLGRRMRR